MAPGTQLTRHLLIPGQFLFAKPLLTRANYSLDERNYYFTFFSILFNSIHTFTLVRWFIHAHLSLRKPKLIKLLPRKCELWNRRRWWRWRWKELKVYTRRVGCRWILLFALYSFSHLLEYKVHCAMFNYWGTNEWFVFHVLFKWLTSSRVDKGYNVFTCPFVWILFAKEGPSEREQVKWKERRERGERLAVECKTNAPEQHQHPSLAFVWRARRRMENKWIASE